MTLAIVKKNFDEAEIIKIEEIEKRHFKDIKPTDYRKVKNKNSEKQNREIEVIPLEEEIKKLSFAERFLPKRKTSVSREDEGFKLEKIDLPVLKKPDDESKAEEVLLISSTEDSTGEVKLKKKNQKSKVKPVFHKKNIIGAKKENKTLNTSLLSENKENTSVKALNTDNLENDSNTLDIPVPEIKEDTKESFMEKFLPKKKASKPEDLFSLDIIELEDDYVDPLDGKYYTKGIKYETSDESEANRKKSEEENLKEIKSKPFSPLANLKEKVKLNTKDKVKDKETSAKSPISDKKIIRTAMGWEIPTEFFEKHLDIQTNI